MSRALEIQAELDGNAEALLAEARKESRSSRGTCAMDPHLHSLLALLDRVGDGGVPLDGHKVGRIADHPMANDPVPDRASVLRAIVARCGGHKEHHPELVRLLRRRAALQELRRAEVKA
jgi:hypothetical protein